jgi:hypothetical protein
MRTTVRVDDELLREAKQLAARTGRTLTAVIEDALRETFSRQHGPAERTVELPTFRGGGLQPGVDLDDSAALLELMDRADAAD